MVRLPKAERHQRLLGLLRRKPHTEKELISSLRCSGKTLQRDLIDLEQDGFAFVRGRGVIRLASEGLRRSSDEADHRVTTALRLLNTLQEVKNRQGLDRSNLRSRLSAVYRQHRDAEGDIGYDADSAGDEALSKMIERDIALLVGGGYLREEQGRLFSGERLLPVPALNQEEIIHLCRLIREYAGLSPYASSLSSLLGKLLAASPHRSAVADSPLLEKYLQRTAVHGKRFNQDWSLARWRDLLDYAVDRRRKVKIRFSRPESQSDVRIISPLGLCYNRYNDNWYVYVLPLSQEGCPQAMRLDRIIELEVQADEPFEWPAGFDLSRCTAHSWGVSMGDRARVRVRFADVFNVLAKVQREVKHRPGATFTPCDGGGILEDEVDGLNEFRGWLRQFGYAAEVLEPAGMRQEFLMTARKTLERYGEGVSSPPGEGH